MAITKIKILGAVLELPAKQHCQSSPNGLNWQCFLAGSSKTAPMILVSIAMGADYLFEAKNIEIWVPTFFKHNNLSIATVIILKDT